MCFTTIVCLIILSPLAKAQTSDNSDFPPIVHQEFLRKAREGELEIPKPAKNQNLQMAQIREDFRRIQSINAERIRPAVNNNSLAYGNIAKAAAEIERRAKRLKSNLALPESSDGPIPAEQSSLTYTEQMKRLDSSISNFVSNSIFRSTAVVDVQLAEKASRDLREIILVSSWLKRRH